MSQTPTLDGPPTLVLPRTELFIDGTWQPSCDGGTLTVEDPATGDVFAEVSSANSEDAWHAAKAAEHAQPTWGALAPRARAEILRRAFDLMKAAKHRIADIIVAENGKSRTDALAEVDYAAEFFRWYSEEAVRLPGYLSQSPQSDRRIIEISQPVGVSLLLAPWNLPAAMITRKVAPALAAGCTAIVKPSPQTPLTALLIAEILAEAGVPAGVVNMLPTDQETSVVAELIDDGPVRMVSFTGSTRVGSMLLRQASTRILNTSMELGGNAPFIVFADADIDAAVAGAVTAKMRHNAEACTAANRFYVHANVRKQFVAKLTAAFSQLRIGPGYAPDVQIGPMVSARARDSLRRAVFEATDHGGTIRLGESQPDGPGYFFAPVLIDDVPADSPILDHELFGPVAPVVEFSTTAEVVEMANNTEMGLGSYIYTDDLKLGLRTAEQLHTGMVGLNTGMFSDPAAPFGGVKQSGIGREGGRHGIGEFLETKYIATTW
jgi:succinate-semialdehyde dehydrogenase/glutarate-semialdehyde dehydrogenase